uniref:Uncharacterized protein n=1 Tax=viral metagenome TaxID=1070528 RepID=A0A6C0HRS3_9ZZZZ
MRLNPKNHNMITFFNNLKLDEEFINKNTKACLKEIHSAIVSCPHYVFSNRSSAQEIKKSVRFQTPIAEGIKDSIYMPKEIQEFIKFTPCRYITYETIQNGRRIIIHFCTYDDDEYDEYVPLMLNVLWVLDKFSHKSCLKSKDFHIYIYFTYFAKILTDGIIASKHINTGVNVKTASCSSKHHENINEIAIYRKEDWFKVFIHESIHSFRLDFSENGKDGLKMLFPVTTDFNLFEAYTEFWAEIINMTYCAMVLDPKFEKVIQNMNIMLQIERRFSLYQAMKILKYMNLTYENVITSSEKYREETNVFSYFVLKLCLMYNFNNFFMCCKKNGKNLLNYDEKKIIRIIDFIEQHYKGEKLLKDIRFMEKLNIKDKDLLNNAKMTLFELI